MVLMIGAHMAQTSCSRLQISARMTLDHRNPIADLHSRHGLQGSCFRWIQRPHGRLWSRQSSRADSIIGDSGRPLHPGGNTIGGATLSRFLPSMFCPSGNHVCLYRLASLAGSSPWHFRNSCCGKPVNRLPIAPSTKSYSRKRQTVLAIPGVARYHICTLLIIAISVAASVVGPPALDRPPDPSILAADPTPDWYLLWYFGLLRSSPDRMKAMS